MSPVQTASAPSAQSAPEPRLRARQTLAPAPSGPGETIGDKPSSQGFGALLAAYRSTGGTARGDDLARLLEDHFLGDFVSLAKLIASDKVFGFTWRDTFWIPMFQFDLVDLSVKGAARQVLAELGGDFDGWARAAWFVAPNPWLNGRRPVDLLKSNLLGVLDAARADRFVASG